MSGVEAEAGAKFGNAVVVTGGLGFGGDADGDLGGRVDRQDGDYNGRMVKCG